MPWSPILLPADNPNAPLPERIDALFTDQRARWPAFREGEASLASLQTRVLTDGDARILVQANPGRRRSTHAKVDARSIAERPCFLCPANIPPEERGIPFGDLVILPNPYPILPKHCTIPSREHRPQRLAARIGDLLELAAAAGPELVVFYNGPRCGASAPDHFHFQACASTGLPVFDEWPDRSAHEFRTDTTFGRSMILCADADPTRIEADLTRALETLTRAAPDDDEPMVNLLATVRDGRIHAVLFPRSAHRPSCYSAPGDAQLAISPAALEMAGILVLADPAQLDRVDANAARRIYEEVSLSSPLPPAEG